MNITWSVVILTLALLGVFGTQMFAKSKKTRKMFVWIGVVGVVVSVLGFANVIPQLNQTIALGGLLAVEGGAQQESPNVQTDFPNQQPTYQPTATYTTTDKFGTTTVTGTSYYKADGEKAGTTAISNVNEGTEYSYWVSNSSSYYVDVLTFTAQKGANNKVATAYRNGTISLTGYDIVQHQSTSDSVYNSSMGANDNAKIEFTVIGGAKTSAVPFGGVLVIETNSTIPTIGCSGDGVVGLNSKYQVTFTPSATVMRYVVYELEPGFDVSTDNGNTGVTKIIRCDFTNGATAVGSGGVYRAIIIPANNYLGNDGNIYTDVEQKINGATTRTGLGGVTSVFYWGA